MVQAHPVRITEVPEDPKVRWQPLWLPLAHPLEEKVTLGCLQPRSTARVTDQGELGGQCANPARVTALEAKYRAEPIAVTIGVMHYGPWGAEHPESACLHPVLVVRIAGAGKDRSDAEVLVEFAHFLGDLPPKREIRTEPVPSGGRLSPARDRIVERPGRNQRRATGRSDRLGGRRH